MGGNKAMSFGKAKELLYKAVKVPADVAGVEDQGRS